MIYIITALWRTVNLKYIEPTIPKECHWIIVVDETVRGMDLNLQRPEDHTILHSGISNSAYGHSNMNYVFDNFPFKDDDWIRFCNDDGIIHKEWYENIEHTLHHDMNIIWGWLSFYGRDCSVHTPVHKMGPDPGAIDLCCYMVKWKYAKDVRFPEDGHPYLKTGDGWYIHECCFNSEKWLRINKYLGWHNPLPGGAGGAEPDIWEDSSAISAEVNYFLDEIYTESTSLMFGADGREVVCDRQSLSYPTSQERADILENLYGVK